MRSFDHIGRMSVSERAALIKDLGPELNQDFAPKELKKIVHMLDKLQVHESLLYRPKADDDVKRALEFVDREWPKITAYVESVFHSWQLQEYRYALDNDLVEISPFSATTPQALVRQGMVETQEATDRFADDAYKEYEAKIKTAVAQGDTYPLLDDLSGDLVNKAIKNGLALAPTARKVSKHGGLSSDLLQRLPLFERASVEQILDIRERLSDYLGEFRGAVDEWSRDITASSWEHKQFHQEANVVYSRQVVQAVENIEHKVEASRSLKSMTALYGLPLAKWMGGSGIGTLISNYSALTDLSILACGLGGSIWEGRDRASRQEKEINSDSVYFYYRAARDLRNVRRRRS